MLPGAREGLQALMSAGVPFVFTTNGGGEREWKKCAALSKTLSLPFHPEQIILSHTPLKREVSRFADKKILVLGCREVLDVAKSYGATKALDVPALCHHDPFTYPFLHWEPRPLPAELAEEPFAAVFCLHDPNNWGAEIQTTLDVLRGGVPLGSGASQAIPYYASNDDLTFAGVHPVPRLAAGAFTRALSHVFREVTGSPLTVTQCGKPTRMTFEYAAHALGRWALLERMLRQWAGVEGVTGVAAAGVAAHRGLPLADQSLAAAATLQEASGGRPLPDVSFTHIFHVGDNPAADVQGANAAGGPWRSILVRTGIYQGKPGENHEQWPAHVVVDGVADAVKHVLEHV